MADEAENDRRRIEAVYRSYDLDGSVERWDRTQPGNAAILAERAREVGRVLTDLPAPRRTLELGCGRAQVLRSLPVGDGPRLGVDILGARLHAAAPASPPVLLVEGDGAALPLADGTIDLVATFTVFSSVLDEEVQASIAQELARVLRPGGRLLWYDLRRANPANRWVRPIDRRDLRMLFPGWTAELTSTTVLPPLARRLGPRTERWYPRLARLRPLCTHLIGLLTRPS